MPDSGVYCPLKRGNTPPRNLSSRFFNHRFDDFPDIGVNGRATAHPGSRHIQDVNIMAIDEFMNGLRRPLSGKLGGRFGSNQFDPIGT